jgi:hypothetical protein
MSRGVFKIIGGRGAFLVVTFEDELFLHDYTVEDRSSIVIEESIGLSDTLEGFIPMVHIVQGGSGLSMSDGTVVPSDKSFFEDGLSLGDSLSAVSPPVHQAVLSSTMARPSDEAGIKSSTEFQSDTMSVSDTFEAIIETEGN